MEKKEESRLDVASVVAQLKAIDTNLDSISIVEFVALCLSFTKLSGSMGKLVAWGFQDIFTKCRILTEQSYNHPECLTLQEIVTKEISLNLHSLSGSNNSSHPKGKDPAYAKYESGIITVLLY